MRFYQKTIKDFGDYFCYIIINPKKKERQIWVLTRGWRYITIQTSILTVNYLNY